MTATQAAAAHSPTKARSVITDQPSCKMSMQQAATSQLWSIAERILWVLAAAGVVVYGNGHHDLLTVALYHPAIWRNAYYIGVAGVSLNICVFLYLAFKGVLSNTSAKDNNSWEVQSPIAIHLGTAAGITAITGFLAAFWPVWSIVTPIVLFVLLMGFVMTISMLPSFSSIMGVSETDAGR